MISLYYAKKIGNQYVLNFYADTEEDVTNFDPAENFMFYGKPAVGSAITLVKGTAKTNYYLNNSGKFVEIKYPDLSLYTIEVGSYNATTDVWTKGATYSLDQTNLNFKVTGEIPYGPKDKIFPDAAGNRFAIRIYNKNITSTTQLPAGNIVYTTKDEGYNVYTKAAFETDGSLITIFAPTEATLDKVREVKIAWTKAGASLVSDDFVTYTFDLSNTTLAPAPDAE